MENLGQIVLWLLQVAIIIGGVLLAIFGIFGWLGVYPKESKLVFGRAMLLLGVMMFIMTIWFYQHQPPFVKRQTADEIYKQLISK
jgi:hypothetical protein